MRIVTPAPAGAASVATSRAPIVDTTVADAAASAAKGVACGAAAFGGAAVEVGACCAAGLANAACTALLAEPSSGVSGTQSKSSAAKAGDLAGVGPSGALGPGFGLQVSLSAEAPLAAALTFGPACRKGELLMAPLMI